MDIIKGNPLKGLPTIDEYNRIVDNGSDAKRILCYKKIIVLYENKRGVRHRCGYKTGYNIMYGSIEKAYENGERL